ncbi:MAG: 50S ribosomal protein L13 [Candidatus Shikimatogenerans sp. JK-2022]|nr:50S ribosomal protein L13 [Candidatus Shikimatogenerans bostrichidophilus]
MKNLNFITKFYKNKKKIFYLINAENETLGRLCSNTIKLLIGKIFPNYTPNLSFIQNKIIIINSKKIKLNKKKINKKMYFKYTGYIGNKKKYSMKDIYIKNPNFLIKKSLYRMLPKNKLGEKAKKNIYIYSDSKYKNIKYSNIIKYKINGNK